MKNLITVPNSMITLLFLFAVMSLGSLAVACPDYLEADCQEGTAWFGLRSNDSYLAQGQIVTLGCDAAVSSVEFSYQVTGNPLQGVPSMVAGDEIFAAVLDMDDNVITTTSNTIPADQYDDWIEFVFPESIVVPAGQYRVVSSTNAPGQCGIRFCYEEGDLYEDGQRTFSFYGINGPWEVFSHIDDEIAFRVHLIEGSVSTKSRHWGTIKGMYR